MSSGITAVPFGSEASMAFAGDEEADQLHLF